MLDQEKYGIWMTIFSVISWFNIMDVGLGNGFRNKFGNAIALNNNELAKNYLNTFYSSMGIISFSLLLAFSICIPFIDWYTVLNLSTSFNENITLIVWLVFALFCFQLFLKNISTVLLALQKTNASNLLVFLGNALSLVIIYLLSSTSFVSLLTIAVAFMISPVIVFLLASIYYYVKRKIFRPKVFLLPNKKYFKVLMNLGIKFFLIQIATMILFSSSNIIITHLYGPAQVTPYSVALRLFSTLQVFFTIIITPFWSAFTEANASQDFGWIKKSIKKLISIWSFFAIGVLIFWVFSPLIIRVWVGESILVSRGLALQFAIFTLLITWSGLFVSYINGVGKIKLQLYIGLIQSIINIPLAILLAKYFDLNLIGIILSTNLLLLISAIFMPMQYFKIISGKAKGVWVA